MRALLRSCLLGLLVCALGAFPASAQEAKRQAAAEKEEEAEARKNHELLAKIRTYSGEIKKAGYEMSKVNVDIGLRPAVSVELVRKRKISDEDMQRILEENKKNKTLHLILKGLRAANKLNLAGYRLEQVTVVFTIPPKTTLVLAPTD